MRIKDALTLLREDSERVSSEGVNALDLISSEPMTPGTFSEASLMLKASFGVMPDDAKLVLLFNLMREENWSEERFKRTLKWFLKNKLWPAWTIADWFSYSVKLYPYPWAQTKMTEGKVPGKDIWRWKLPDGQIAYSEAYVDLPFERVDELPKSIPVAECPECGRVGTLKEYNTHDCKPTL